MMRQLAIGAFSIVFSGFAAAQEEKPVVVDAEHETVTATVVDIDHEARMIRLQKPEGNTLIMEVGPEVTRFEEVGKGDRVKVDYLESVAVEVRQPEASDASVEASESFLVRNPGVKPSGTSVQTNVITATVEEIDTEERTATLKGPGGNLVEVDVAPDVPNLRNVKPGDRVIVEVTRSLAINIENPD